MGSEVLFTKFIGDLGFAKWCGNFKLEAASAGIKVFSTRVTALPYSNVTPGKFPDTNISITVIDQSEAEFKPFVLKPHLHPHEFIEKHGKGLIAWSDGFNNLKFNRGFAAWFNGEWTEYDLNYPQPKTAKREILVGEQSALFKRKGQAYPEIGTLTMKQIESPRDLEYVFIGPRLIRSGGRCVSDLLQNDNETERPLISDLLGDWRQVVRIPKRDDFGGFPIAGFLTDKVTHGVSEAEWRSAPSRYDRPVLRDALTGKVIEVLLGEYPADAIERELANKDEPLAGYEYLKNFSATKPGQFNIINKKLHISLARSLFNHSLICTVKDDPSLLILYKEMDEGYTEGRLRPKRNGFTHEDTAAAAKALCAGLSNEYGGPLDIDQAIDVSEGGDPRLTVLSGQKRFETASYKPNFFPSDRKDDKTCHAAWVSLFGIYSRG